ncbi:3-oxoacyl-[acyl-carrier-protein] reductase [Wickerhamomyces ciferrii]|uniref:3-oxoacyl-[acyl-carrier-protein] reductase n=1 Tax=Wickerhamomyces ciferrii (strain ATCC 14091 / BCRC 22168 / CBS 111 / JCM 3599 / NBRC 0793 / NRRL Y-1031 F-60-10) TaxID=1206466 RepID=K0KNA9_WICCF|nr:3-oxoacyl-[acyl-carrier-protein] reductase [Wickerhamomyces ciferrii]CCH42854.1 3-oxoacyl-[acyl-carrier-protein] reductase [Wickerhamomyces ciferrii]
MGKVYFISGATRGIGLQLATQLSQADSSNTVIATARNPITSTGLKELASKQKNVHIIKLDVSSEESINGIDEQIVPLASETGIDVYISNGAIGDLTPIQDLNRQSYIDHFLTNVLGPFIGGQVSDFSPLLTGACGITKVGLNHAALQLSIQYQDEDFTVIPLHPGFVNTELANDVFNTLPENQYEVAESFRAQFITPAESASGIINNIINQVTIEDSGKFYRYDGKILPY